MTALQEGQITIDQAVQQAAVMGVDVKYERKPPSRINIGGDGKIYNFGTLLCLSGSWLADE